MRLACEVCGRHRCKETGFPPNNSGLPCLYHSISIHFTTSSTRCSYQKEKGAKRGNLRKETIFIFKIGGL